MIYSKISNIKWNLAALNFFWNADEVQDLEQLLDADDDIWFEEKKILKTEEWSSERRKQKRNLIIEYRNFLAINDFIPAGKEIFYKLTK